MNHSGTQIRQWIESLRDQDRHTRTAARKHLVAAGEEVVPRVTRLLRDPVQHVRWEAAKVLLGIASPAAVPALIEALGDKDRDVAWVAGEALAGIGEPAVPELLRRLSCKPQPNQGKPDLLYRGAHQVFESLRRRMKTARFDRLLKALKAEEPEVYVPLAAEEAMRD